MTHTRTNRGTGCNAHLEHLDVRDTEIEVCRVAEDKTAGEEYAYGEDGFDKHILVHVDIFDAIEQSGCSLQHAGSNGL